MDAMVAEIKAEFADEEGWSKTTPIPRTTALLWMRQENMDVLGAMHRLLRYKGGLERITPPLDFKDYYAFMTRYYRRCLCEFSADVWELPWQEADWGINATHEVVYWFFDLWHDKSVSWRVLQQTKEWLAEILLECPQVSGLLATAIYDHLLNRQKLRKFFADWEADPRLSRFLS